MIGELSEASILSLQEAADELRNIQTENKVRLTKEGCVFCMLWNASKRPLAHRHWSIGDN
jgi:hypothetical protein